MPKQPRWTVHKLAFMRIMESWDCSWKILIDLEIHELDFCSQVHEQSKNLTYVIWMNASHIFIHKLSKVASVLTTNWHTCNKLFSAKMPGTCWSSPQFGPLEIMETCDLTRASSTKGQIPLPAEYTWSNLPSFSRGCNLQQCNLILSIHT